MALTFLTRLAERTGHAAVSTVLRITLEIDAATCRTERTRFAWALAVSIDTTLTEPARGAASAAIRCILRSVCTRRAVVWRRFGAVTLSVVTDLFGTTNFAALTAIVRVIVGNGHSVTRPTIVSETIAIVIESVSTDLVR